MTKTRKLLDITRITIALILACIILFPLFLVALNSFESPIAMSDYIQSIHDITFQKWVYIKIVPERVTLDQYYSLLIEKTGYLRLYINSAQYALSVVIGQVLIGAMAAYALSCFQIKFRNFFFFLYLILMLLPFQVTMVPNFIILRAMGLINSRSALILPSIFAPFSVLLLRQYMVTIPKPLLEASTIDGANILQMFTMVVLPICKPVLCIASILVFADVWNMVEQPLVLIRDLSLYPLSLALIGEGGLVQNAEYAAAVLYFLPPLLIFLYFQEDLILNLQISEYK